MTRREKVERDVRRAARQMGCDCDLEIVLPQRIAVTLMDAKLLHDEWCTLLQERGETIDVLIYPEGHPA